MGLIRSNKANDAGSPNPVAAEPEAAPGALWVRLGAEGLWAGVLSDDALGTLPESVDEPAPAPAPNAEPPAASAPAPTSPATEELDDVLARPQEPGSAAFRILCGAKTADGVRQRFGWKTDKELADAYEIAVEERRRAQGIGDDEGAAYWEALVDASVREAVSRPAFGELTEWEEADEGRREKRETLRRLSALAKVREDALRSQSGN